MTGAVAGGVAAPRFSALERVRDMLQGTSTISPSSTVRVGSVRQGSHGNCYGRAMAVFMDVWSRYGLPYTRYLIGRIYGRMVALWTAAYII